MFKQKKQNLPSSPTDYPVGTFIKSEKGYFYIASNYKRFRITTKRVLDSWSPPRIALTTEAAVSKYRIVAKMGFRNGSLIHNFADGRIYLIADNERHHIISPDVLTRLGATREDVVPVSLPEIKLQNEGDSIN